MRGFVLVVLFSSTFFSAPLFVNAATVKKICSPGTVAVPSGISITDATTFGAATSQFQATNNLCTDERIVLGISGFSGKLTDYVTCRCTNQAELDNLGCGAGKKQPTVTFDMTAYNKNCVKPVFTFSKFWSDPRMAFDKACAGADMRIAPPGQCTEHGTSALPSSGTPPMTTGTTPPLQLPTMVPNPVTGQPQVPFTSAAPAPTYGVPSQVSVPIGGTQQYPQTVGYPGYPGSLDQSYGYQQPPFQSMPSFLSMPMESGSQSPSPIQPMSQQQPYAQQYSGQPINQPQSYVQANTSQNISAVFAPASLIIVQPSEVRKGAPILISWTSVGMSTSHRCQITSSDILIAEGNGGSFLYTTSSYGTAQSMIFTLSCEGKDGIPVQNIASITLI